MFRNQKAKEEAYQLRIAQLQSELEEAAKNLSECMSDIAKTQDEVHKIEKDIAEKEVVLETRKAELVTLDKTISFQNGLFMTLVESYNRYVDVQETRKEELGFEIFDLETKLVDLPKQIDGLETEYESIKETIVAKNVILSENQNKIDDQEKRLADLAASIGDYENKIAEWQTLVDKNAKMLTKTEMNLVLIDNLATQLQGYSDQMGIGLDVRKFFNI